MNGKLVRKWNLTTVWNDDRIESWLAGMAAQGWHLEKVGWVGLFTFRQGAPARVTYRVDIAPLDGKPDAGYLQLLADAGWRMAARWSTWSVWRSERPGAPELFSDGPSRAARYQRISMLLGIGVLLHTGIVCLHGATLLHRPDTASNWQQGAVLLNVAALLFNLYGYARLRTRLRALVTPR